MKILYYIHELRIGGAETIVVQYLSELKRRGHEVALVVNDRTPSFLEKRLEAAEIEIISLRPAFAKGAVGKCQRGILKYTGYYKRRWKQIFDALEPDVFHIHTAVNFLDKMCFLPQRTVYTFHGDVARYVKMHGEKNFETMKKLARNGMSFFSLSQKMSCDIQNTFQTDRIVYVPNGVDIRELQRKGYEKKVFLKERGLPQTAFLLGHIGRFHPVKNQVRAVEIFAEVLKRRPEAYLLLIGDGNAAYLEKVKKTAVAQGVGGHILFLGEREDAVQFMDILDALVLPSFAESFSLVLVEAQAKGLRAVASDVVPDEVICNDNCFSLSLEEKNEKWAEYLLGSFTEERNRDIEVFSIDRVIDGMLQSYKKLLEE